MRRVIGSTLVAALAASAAHGAIVSEVYTERSAFEARLAGAVRSVGFDDLDTASVDPLAFASDRYAPAGVLVRGAAGQYASRDFGFPEDYPVSSAPNGYAPGPIDDTIGGGNETEVTFVAGADPALVAGFGAVFVDPDLAFASRLSVFDDTGTPVREVDVPAADGELVFRGIVTVDDVTGMPTPAIARVEIVNGTGWPAGTFNDGVPLDDFVFAVPASIGAGTTTTTLLPSATTTSTTLPGAACAAAPLAGCRRPIASAESVLVVRKRRNAARSVLTWLWQRGAATAKEDFGRPPETTGFAFCLYDASGLRLGAAVPAGGTCAGALCWATTAAGYRYRNATPGPDGVRLLRLRSGGDGKARIALETRGAALAPVLPLAVPVVAQLVRSDGGGCWDARFSLARRSTATRFRAFSD